LSQVVSCYTPLNGLKQEYLFQISGIYLEFKGEILTEEFAVDLASGLCWGKSQVPCLQPVTDVFQLNIRRDAMQLHFVHIRKFSYFPQCSMQQSWG
jgi:hypothetical protein